VTSRAPIGFYYGGGHLEKLLHYERVVLQPAAYAPAELIQLRRGGVQALAYLSLSEDQGPPAPWQRPQRNPDWGGAMVHVGDPRWVDHVRSEADAALEAGFEGLFLDQLNVEFTFPEDIPHLLTLIAGLRQAAGIAYLLANRGFAMLPRLAELVDGVLFESFSARWTDTGYAAWPDDVLDVHGRMAERLLEFDFDLYALDYATSADLAEFATRRAGRFGLHSFVSNRELSRI
jgi:polysaccharide biosynthesis protein PelA